MVIIISNQIEHIIACVIIIAAALMQSDTNRFIGEFIEEKSWAPLGR